MYRDCDICGKTFREERHRESFICSNCEYNEKERVLNSKLDDIKDLYTLEQRVRAIERYIFQQDKGLKYE